MTHNNDDKLVHADELVTCDTGSEKILQLMLTSFRPMFTNNKLPQYLHFIVAAQHSNFMLLRWQVFQNFNCD